MPKSDFELLTGCLIDKQNELDKALTHLSWMVNIQRQLALDMKSFIGALARARVVVFDSDDRQLIQKSWNSMLDYFGDCSECAKTIGEDMQGLGKLMKKEAENILEFVERTK